MGHPKNAVAAFVGVTQEAPQRSAPINPSFQGRPSSTPPGSGFIPYNDDTRGVLSDGVKHGNTGFAPRALSAVEGAGHRCLSIHQGQLISPDWSSDMLAAIDCPMSKGWPYGGWTLDMYYIACQPASHHLPGSKPNLQGLGGGGGGTVQDRGLVRVYWASCRSTSTSDLDSKPHGATSVDK
ncbi:hypothetical protein Cob_v004504 [Colletotrichum orbiculare MAFF 240422]|uniref:Uncharacterized protein n=1 Tax=Colletotrichum orbiculare (strain 104-T / ATCC 96160 / CBS 514.97 / LARS 414 / MAFF 240422) TaxID=1213857 RepID=A0A484FWG0_COLOR|nr:hypothetical protein Cob_v004504 [Colletotrichum orbiculare MAFF 240422]